MIAALLVVGVIGLITFAYHRMSTNQSRYFEERNLTYSGGLLGFRNIFYLIFRRRDIFELTLEMYDKFSKER